jgi:glutamate-1-semialdehyde 2,1-aminomutase
MKKVQDIFYSFTSGGETLSIAAAIATIREMERKNVIKHIWEKGEYLQKQTTALLEKNGLGEIIKLKGKPCWQVFAISSTKQFSNLEISSFLQQEIIQAGFIWDGDHNMSFSHSREDMDKLLKAYEKIFPRLRELLDNGKLRQAMKGGLITSIFKVRKRN